MTLTIQVWSQQNDANAADFLLVIKHSFLPDLLALLMLHLVLTLTNQCWLGKPQYIETLGKVLVTT